MSVIFDIKNGVGTVRLNRPDKLNALSKEMINELSQTLKAWEIDDRIHWVLLEGAGDHYCAGGDVAQTLRDAADDPLGSMPFFREEFELDLLLHEYKKPLVAHYKGVSMGGGIGLACNAALLFADETTRWAMPETRLGIIPDVGVGYFFSQLPRPDALYLSLTGATLVGADLIPYGFATDYIKAESWSDLRKAFMKVPTDGLSYEEMVAALKEVAAKYHAPLPEETEHQKHIPLIKEHFDAPTLPALMDDLAAAEETFLKETHQKLTGFCPLSLAITFGKYEAGQDISRADTLEKDLHILELCWLSGNAAEGIRCAFIDKKDEPQFKPSSVYEVDYEFIDRLLETAGRR